MAVRYKPRRRMRKSKPRFKRGGRKMTNVNRGLQPIPSRYICKMKYSETVTPDVNGRIYFNLNSIFQPNRQALPGVGSSHQPYGHDQLALFYNRYRVISCGWRLQACTTTAGIVAQIGAIPSNDTIIFVNVSEMKENPRSKYVTVSPGAAAVYLTGKSYMPSLVGRTKAQYMADDRYQATFGTNPGELAILNVLTNTVTDLPTQFTFNILLEYTVELFDVKNVQQS